MRYRIVRCFFMMGSKNKNDREIINNFSLEQLVPQNHLVRKIDKAIDFSFIRDRE